MSSIALCVAPVTPKDAFIKSLLAAVGLSVDVTSTTTVLAKAAIGLAAAALAEALANHIAALPGVVHLAWMQAWKLLTRTKFGYRVLRVVLRFLAARFAKSTCISRQHLRVASHIATEVQTVTVPEKCSNEYGAKTNVIFSDLMWFAAALDATSNFEVVQDAATATINARATDADDADVKHEFHHQDSVVRMEVVTRTRKNAFGVNTEARQIVLSVVKTQQPVNVIGAFIAHVQQERRRVDAGKTWKPVVFRWVKTAWTSHAVPGRKRFEHVALPLRVKAQLMQDIDAFLASEALYEEKGLSWNRGYLLYGPPGCGKSSCILAISNTYCMPIYNVNLSEVSGDVELRAMFANVSERAVVVLEDVDCMSSTNARLAVNDDGMTTTSVRNAGGVTLSGLLNVIDGIESVGGRILIMSTNHRDALDPALIRPGRCDLHVHLPVCTLEHVDHFVDLYIGAGASKSTAMTQRRRSLDDALRSHEITPATVAGMLLPLASPVGGGQQGTIESKCEQFMQAIMRALVPMPKTCDNISSSSSSSNITSEGYKSSISEDYESSSNSMQESCCESRFGGVTPKAPDWGPRPPSPSV